MRIGILFVLLTAPVLAQAPTGSTRSVWDGVYTFEQARRGEPLYRTHCANCHGPELLGRSDFPQPPQPLPPGVFIRPGSPPLKGTTFIADWQGLSLGMLFERDRISMPQNAPGTLTRQVNADILAFILQENGFPAGEGELPTSTEKIDPIRFGR